jgi:hypothetical protein
VIATDDSATNYIETRGYGRAYPAGRWRVFVSGIHPSDAEQHSWRNDTIVVGSGEVRWSDQIDTSDPNASPDLVVDVAEVVWEPIAE